MLSYERRFIIQEGCHFLTGIVFHLVWQRRLVTLQVLLISFCHVFSPKNIFFQFGLCDWHASNRLRRFIAKVELGLQFLPGIVSFSMLIPLSAATGSVGLTLSANPIFVFLFCWSLARVASSRVGNRVFAFCDEGFGYNTGQVTDAGSNQRVL